MFETGKAAQVSAEMARYGIHILGLSETRWIQAGQRRLSSGVQIIYSGHADEDARHTQGVAIMLSQTAGKTLISWEGHGPRLITASFTTKNKDINMNIIQCYAPTNDAEDDNKEEFYNQLQSIIQRLPGKDVNILMGDFNQTTQGWRRSWDSMD